MYESYEVAILWGEKCREELLSSSDIMPSEYSEHENIEATINTESKNNLGMVRTFIPPSTKYSQPTRHFPIEVIENPAYKRDIIRTPPFHPPKSGPSETMIAHICSVYCMEHVHWVLATLLFGDKKVARATHNMFAYRFMKDGILVSVSDESITVHILFYRLDVVIIHAFKINRTCLFIERITTMMARKDLGRSLHRYCN